MFDVGPVPVSSNTGQSAVGLSNLFALDLQAGRVDSLDDLLVLLDMPPSDYQSVLLPWETTASFRRLSHGRQVKVRSDLQSSNCIVTLAFRTSALTPMDERGFLNTAAISKDAPCSVTGAEFIRLEALHKHLVVM